MQKEQKPLSITPTTLIRIFLNPQLFLSGFKNYPAHTQRIQIELVCSHAPDGIRMRPGETRPTRCATGILVYSSVRDWTRFRYVIGF